MQPTPPPPGQDDGFLKELQRSLGASLDGVLGKIDKLKEKNDELDKSILEKNALLAGTFGRTQVAVQGLRLSLVESLPAISSLGGDLGGAFDIIQRTSEELKTNTTLLGGTTKDLFAVQKAFNISEYEMGRVVGKFKDAGIQSGLIRDRMNETLNIARLVGVNSQAVFEGVQENLSRLNEFGFRNGVEGLSRMAAKAASMRFDMRNIFSFAEKVFSPEGAIEAVSTFQRLGVAVGDLADPFRLMYLASEDVEGLTDQVVKMTSKFSYFDEKSKEFKIFPNAKRDLRDLSQAMGIPYEDMVKMTFAQTKLNKLASEFKFNANVEETDKQLIANLAQYSKEKGDFVIKVNREEKLITQLNREDIEELRGRPETVEDVARAQLDETKLMKAAIDGIFDLLRGITVGAKPSQDLAQLIRASTEVTNKAAFQASGRVRGGIKKIDEGYAKLPELLKEITDDFKNGNLDFTKYIGKVKEASESYAGSLQNLAEQVMKFDYKKMVSENPLIDKDNLLAKALGLSVTTTEKLIDKLDEIILKPLENAVSNQASSQSTSSRNQINPNAQVLVTTTVKPEEIVRTKFVSNNQNVSFSPINGNIELKVVTEDGTKVDLTNQIVSSVEFQRRVVSLISERMQNQNYNNLPNSAAIS